MNERHLYTLLYIIQKNADLRNLIRQGLTFLQIANLNQEAISAGFLIESTDRIKLSNSGLKKFEELEKKYKNTNKEKWIDKEINSMIPKIEVDFIYLPNQNELFFD